MKLGIWEIYEDICFKFKFIQCTLLIPLLVSDDNIFIIVYIQLKFKLKSLPNVNIVYLITRIPYHRSYKNPYDFRLLYRLYSNAVINTFIMTSTWLTVTMALSRFVAICHPLRARQVGYLLTATVNILYKLTFEKRV